MVQKYVIILAGPNGAGKSTVQPGLVPPGVPFVNADEIARQLRESGQATETGVDITAGRLLLARLQELERTQSSFAVETNLANRSLALRIPRWQEQGYRVCLFFITAPSADFAVARVAQRVASGGHDIPEATIRRRFEAGLQNLSNTYKPLVDAWYIYDNWTEEGPQRVDEKPYLKAIENGDQMDRAMREAVQKALQEHKRRGQYIVVWHDGNIVRVPAEDIPVRDASSVSERVKTPT
jgi:predicted ABC-type ATPase